MKELIRDIENEIHNQVIQAGEISQGVVYFTDYDIEFEDDTYPCDFYIDTDFGDASEPATYDIEIVFIGIMKDGKVITLYSEGGIFDTLKCLKP